MAPTAHNEAAVAFWPWGQRSAVAASGLLLVILVGGLALLHAAADWPDAQWEAAFALAAVLLGLVPIGLLVLASVAQSQGSVSFRGVSVNFGAAAQAAVAVIDRSTISVPRNVVHEGVDIADSGHTEVLSVLREASRADIVVVDLEDGHSWWDTRLLLLCAGAERQGRPNAVVFVATVERQVRRFIGWATPADVVAEILKADRELEFAYALAQTSTSRAALTFPVRAIPPGSYAVVTPAIPAGAAATPSVVTDQDLFEQKIDMVLPQSPAMAFTRALSKTVGTHENTGKAGHVSVMRLRELLTPVLHTDRIEETASDDEWVSAAVHLDSDFLVVTDKGAYRGLEPRAHLQRAILAAIVSSLAAAPGEAAPSPKAPETVPVQGRTEAPAAPPAQSAPLIPEARSSDR